MTVYRSERERRDEETGNSQLLDETMEAIRCEYRSADEVIEALDALAKVIAQVDMTPKQIEYIKRRLLDGYIDFQRGMESAR
jgi:hypothetical protein